MLLQLKKGEIVLKREEIYHILKNTPLFRNFSESDFLSFLDNRNYYIKEFKKGSVIYLQGQKCETFDIILEGQIIVQSIDEDGNTFTVSEFSAYDTLNGNLVFADSNTFPMTIISNSQVKMLQVRKGLVLELCQRNRNFLYEFIRILSNRALFLGRKLGNITLKTIRKHIIDFLTIEMKTQKSNIIKLNMNKKEWAQKLGVQRPSLSRELAKMKREGLINYTLKTIEIKDVDRL